MEVEWVCEALDKLRRAGRVSWGERDGKQALFYLEFRLESDLVRLLFCFCSYLG